MLNHITIMGRLTRDPELRTLQSGVSVASFTVAVDRDYSGRDGGEKQTDFIDCAAWRQTGEFVSRYFHKGSMIVVAGRLQSRKWQDRDGNNRTSWEVVADNVYFGESRKDGDGAARTAAKPAGAPVDVEPPVSAFVDLPPGCGEDNPFVPPYQQQRISDGVTDDGELPF